MVQHLQAHARLVLCVCGVALASLGYGRGLEAATEASTASAVEGFAIFTMGDAPDRAPSVCGNRPFALRLDTGEALAEWPRGVSSVGIMRSSADRSAIVAGNLYGFYGQIGVLAPGGSVRSSIYVLDCPGNAWDQCVAMPTVRGTDFYVGVEVMSDADTLLVSTAAGREVDGTIPTPPFRVEKYSLSEIRPVRQEPGEWATHVLGARRGAIETQDAVVAIVQDPDGRRAHLLTRGGPDLRAMALLTIDVADMSEAASRIELPLLPQYAFRHVLPRTTLSPDGRLLVATRPGQPSIAVVDLMNRSATLVELAGSLAFSDVSYSYGPDNRGLVALYTYVAEQGPQVVIADVRPTGLTVLGRGPTTLGSIYWPSWALEWTADGRAVVASVFGEEPGPTAALLLVQDSGRRVTWARDLTPCSGRGPMVIDIVTAGGAAPPTPTQPAQTPSPTASAKPTATVTASPTSTATPTPTATPTVPPRPLYLPLALRESCKPGQRRVDVALVIDASTTMRDDRTVAGRTKLDAAIEAATFFVGVMSLPSDQAAVVVFNETATVLQPLTGRRADVEAALARIPRLVREQTRIDRGIEKGHGELTSARRNAANDPVLILLTDGLANPVSASVAVQRADSAKADHITIFTIGLGQATALNVVELAQMASRPQYFYRAPDGEDLQGIYRTIAVEIPCPASRYWGQR